MNEFMSAKIAVVRAQPVVVIKPVNHFKHFIIWVFTVGLSTPVWAYKTIKYRRALRG